jgi:hypothetical protein
MIRNLTTVSALAAALALAGCGNSHTTTPAARASSPSAPVWPSASTTEYKDDQQICKLFTALAALANDLGKTTMTPQARGIITSVIDKYKKPLTVQLRHDAIATLSNPTGPAVVRLQADCGQVGIYKPVWPG